MSGIGLLRIITIAIAGLLLFAGRLRPLQSPKIRLVVRYALAAFAIGHILFVAYLFVDHIDFPLYLDLMEGTVLQHFERAANFEPVYPEPSPQYVPLAYNPLFYVVSIPAGWVFGVNLFTLRLMAIVATIGIAALLYRIVWDRTRSHWWASITVGLLAAAYYVMDTYLDSAHSDSWFVFTALLGSYIIGRNRSRAWNVVGVGVLVAAFWFKQHGALFCFGGVLFLTWREIDNTTLRDGIRRAIPYWVTAAVFGPGLYIFGGRALFGPEFHYFTWEVPRNWSTLDFGTFYRFGMFVIRNYIVLAVAGGLLVLWIGLKERARLDIWHVQFVFAVLTGFMGTLDAGSADNVYIPMGVWFILVGTLALYELATRVSLTERYPAHLAALIVTFSLFFYDPQLVITSDDAPEKYDELVEVLESLDTGLVYAPWQGQLPDGYRLYPGAHWVALEDMIRGPGRNKLNHPTIRRLLDPIVNPEEEAYILTNEPLDYYSWFRFLEDYYTLEQDFGTRFEDLRGLPKRFDHKYPRYLYRYAPEKAAASTPDEQ